MADLASLMRMAQRSANAEQLKKYAPGSMEFERQRLVKEAGRIRRLNELDEISAELDAEREAAIADHVKAQKATTTKDEPSEFMRRVKFKRDQLMRMIEKAQRQRQTQRVDQSNYEGKPAAQVEEDATDGQEEEDEVAAEDFLTQSLDAAQRFVATQPLNRRSEGPPQY